jgi:chemotaxis protein histidine kinase CheA/ActR/RegA family two-component response regulator
LETAQRIAHTLKGSANTVGIRGIAELTHHLEDILTACANERRLPATALAQSLINAADCLESMSDALVSFGPPPSDAKAVLQEILDWANRIDKDGLSGLDITDASTGIQPVLADVAADGQPAAEPARASTIRVPADHIDGLFRLSGESIILNSQAQETARRMKNQLINMQLQFELLQQLGAELEQLIDLKDFSGRGAGSSGLDALEMDQYNELHTASRRMAEAAIDAREMSLDMGKDLEKMSALLDIQQRSVIDAQEVVMQTLLVSIASIAPRLQRSFRQTCRMTSKQGELVLVGENIMIDGDTLNALVDPMMHLLRNAIDHGIESRQERIERGKPENGRVTFEFDREGNHILVRCRDDGRGLDFDAIRAAAERRGMLQSGQAASEEELKNFILQPNFSSRSVSSQTSGRGVGMDVVRAQIVNMGGTLVLDSIAGQGMSVELRVPLPLSMTYALLTRAGSFPVAIANKGIRQIIHSSVGQLVMRDGLEFLLMDGDSYPLARLTDLLHIADQRSENDRSYAAILLADTGEDTTGVLIDAITASQEVVIKSMGHYLGKVPGYIGATILGDGTVTPVLDVPELLRLPARTGFSIYTECVTAIESTSLLPSVLVVDDSLSQRRALEQSLTDAGYRVDLARDGIEAAELLAHSRPDAVLTDLEMPRMNGIELTAHIRSQQKFESMPVLMITSRTTQKHRQMAENAGIDAYFSKPVRDDDLLIELHKLIEQACTQVRATA